MENIYDPKYDKIVNIGERLLEFKKKLCLSRVNRMPTTYDEVKQLSIVSDQSVEEAISISHLAQNDDIRIAEIDLADKHRCKRCDTIEIPAKALALRCVKIRVDNQRETNRAKQTKYNKHKHLRMNYVNSNENVDINAYDEVLITIRVYEPFVYVRGNASSRLPKLSQEFNVLGSQKLTELKDKIYCQCKFGPFKDISDDYTRVLEGEANRNETIDSSNDAGFFFITNTFYNDTRHRNVDYSIEIRDWMETQNDIGEVSVKSMDETLFNDLNVRIGYPQVYKHNCICEHIFTISEIRLIAPDDSLKRCDYPMLTIVSSTTTKLCFICGYEEAEFIVKDSNAHIHDPAFLCKDCVISYHYIDGKKKGSFKLYNYYGNQPIKI